MSLNYWEIWIFRVWIIEVLLYFAKGGCRSFSKIDYFTHYLREGCEFKIQLSHKTFIEIDHEIISTDILFCFFNQWKSIQLEASQLAFYVNLHRAVIGPSATLTGRWRPDIDLRRMLTGLMLFTKHIFLFKSWFCILSHMILAVYYGFTLDVCVSVWANILE